MTTSEFRKFREELSALDLGTYYQRGYDEYKADPATTQYPTNHFQRMSYLAGKHYREELAKFYTDPAYQYKSFVVDGSPCKNGWTRGAIHYVDPDPLWEDLNAIGGYRCVYLGDLPNGEILQYINDLYYWNSSTTVDESNNDPKRLTVSEVTILNHLDADGNLINKMYQETTRGWDGVDHRTDIEAQAACLRLVFDDYRECLTGTPESVLASHSE